MQPLIKRTLLFAQTICFPEAGPAPGITKAGRCLRHEFSFSIPFACSSAPAARLMPATAAREHSHSGLFLQRHQDQRQLGSLHHNCDAAAKTTLSWWQQHPILPVLKRNLEFETQGLLTIGFVFLDLAKSSQVLQCPVWQKPFQQNVNLTPRIRSCVAPWNLSYLKP